jgi:hypothetical protein
MGGCGIAVSMISLNVGIMCLVASMSMLLVGYTQESDYVSEFTTYNSATCTLVSFKVNEAEASYGSRRRFLAVAGVTLLSSPTVYAAVKQANTTRNYDTPLMYTRMSAVNLTFFPSQYQIGSSYPCGVPSDGTFDEATTAPFERAVALNFNREEAIAYTETGAALVIAGWVCIGIGVVFVPFGIFMMCGGDDCCEDCYDDCCDDCDCSCSCDSCCDRYEEWKLEQRINSSHAAPKGGAAANSAANNSPISIQKAISLTTHANMVSVNGAASFVASSLARSRCPLGRPSR